ncbi:MAG: hypothetical protein P8184_15905 [Calditrichia bacterium]
MLSTQQSVETADLTDAELKEYYENLIAYVRSRLNIIGTSLYLLETHWSSEQADVLKYIRKINEEMESIRKFIND